MRVLGLDPGLRRLGFGGVELTDKGLVLLSHGMIEHPRDPLNTYNRHLNLGIEQIVDSLPKVIDMIKPHCVYAELVPPGRLGMNSELVVAAITACKVIVYQFGIPWNDIGANTVKKITTNDPKASKTLVRNTVIEMLPQVGERHKLLKAEQKESGEAKPIGLPQDVFDALAVAIAGLNKQE